MHPPISTACPSMSTTTIDRDRFGHFLNAQGGGVWERALHELRRGTKTGHWMWFVFPQISGLGSSEMARAFVALRAIVGRRKALRRLTIARWRDYSKSYWTVPLTSTASG